jgi:hypothetical protein
MLGYPSDVVDRLPEANVRASGWSMWDAAPGSTR